MDNFQQNLQIQIDKKELNQAVKHIINAISRTVKKKTKKFSTKTKEALKPQKKCCEAC